MHNYGIGSFLYIASYTMPYSVTYDQDHGLIVVKIEGRIGQNLIKSLVSDVALIAKEKDCFLLLNDARDATVDLSTVDIYHLPELLTDTFFQFDISLYKFKRAIVISRGLREMEDFIFFETVSKNRGHNLNIFHDIKTAKQWLCEQQ